MEPVLLPGHFHGRGGNGAAADEERETRPACLGVEAGCDAGRDEQHGFRRIDAVEAGPAREPVEAVVPPDVLGEAEECSGLGIEHARAVETARGFPEQGAGAFQCQEASMCLTMASGVMTMEGVSSCPFFSMRLSSTAKACFASMPGGTDTARTLPDMRNGEGPASGPRCRRSSRTCPIASGFEVVGPRPQGGSCFRTTKRIRGLLG